MVVSSKSCKSRPNRWFFVIFHEMSHFFHLFAEKLTKTRKHGSLLEKLQLLAKSMMFRSLSRNEPLFAEKLTKTPKHGSFVEELQVLGKSMIFRASRRNEPLFPEKLMEMQRHGSLFEKLQSFGQIDDFWCFLTNWATFCNLWLKSSSKHQNMVVCSKTLHSFCQIDEFSCFFTKWGSFCNFLLKSASKRQNMVVSSKSCKFWPNPWVFVLFYEMNHFLQKVPHFVKKHEKSSIWPNLCNFSNKLPCLCISMDFSGKSCRKCLISWKSTRNHRFGQDYATFSNKLPCFGVSMNLLAKGSKKLLNSWKTTKNHRFGQNLQLSSKQPCLCIFMNFSERSCKKCLISWKSTRNHRFRKHYATFQTNYHVFAFRWSFKEKVGKSGSFREKARKLMDLVKTCNFSKKLPCFCVSMNFMAKICKNCVIS